MWQWIKISKTKTNKYFKCYKNIKSYYYSQHWLQHYRPWALQPTANVEMTKKYNVLCYILSGLPEVANILFCDLSSDTSISWSVPGLQKLWPPAAPDKRWFNIRPTMERWEVRTLQPAVRILHAAHSRYVSSDVTFQRTGVEISLVATLNTTTLS